MFDSVDESQYRALRDGVALTTSTDRSFIAVGGSDCIEFLQGQITNDVEAIGSGEGCYALLLTNKGKLQTDLRVLRRDDDFLIDTQSSTLQSLLGHLKRFMIGHKVKIEELYKSLTTVMVLGPGSVATLNTVLENKIELPAQEHSHMIGIIGGKSVRLVTADHRTLGYELVLEQDDVEIVTSSLKNCGAEPVSPSAFECLRIERGIPAYGIDMTSDNFPAEAGLEARAVSFEKGCYIGQEPVARMHYRGHPNRRLMGLTSSSPMETGEVLTHSEKKVGTVGSSCISPRLGPIALAIVRREVNPGDEVTLGQGDKRAKIVTLPFHNGSNS